MRQILSAELIYADQHDGDLPPDLWWDLRPLFAYGLTSDVLRDPHDPYAFGANRQASESAHSVISYQFPPQHNGFGKALRLADDNSGMVACLVCRDRRFPQLAGTDVIDFVGPIYRGCRDGSVRRVRMPAPKCFPKAGTGNISAGFFEWFAFTDAEPTEAVYRFYDLAPDGSQIVPCPETLQPTPPH
jgi:hypothetical protein